MKFIPSKKILHVDKELQKKYSTEADIKIYQIYFEQSQYQMLDPAFIPYDNSQPSRDMEYEFGVFMDNFENKNYLTARYTGFISWRFYEKTKLNGTEYLHFIKCNPDYDVYFVNPFPGGIRWKNIWLQGDKYHSGILNFTQELMDKLGYGINLENLENNLDTLLYCNYWVGNKKFWNSYMNFVSPLYDYIKNDMSPDEANFINQDAGHVREANYFPFIFERMFSTLLATNPDNIKFLAFK